MPALFVYIVIDASFVLILIGVSVINFISEGRFVLSYFIILALQYTVSLMLTIWGIGLIRSDEY